MSLRLRLAGVLALVALLTALAIALTAPAIIGRGFARLEADETGAGGGQGPAGAGQGPGPMAGLHAAQIQRDTTESMIAAAAFAAVAASLLGFVMAGWITSPLRRLEVAAAALARGDLAQRSGLAARRDEIGSLGRSFDAMAAELGEAEASRRRLFQDVAHELKTPLAVIDATATAVLDGVYTDGPTHLETIRTQARILSRIVDDLRTISLAEGRHLPLQLVAVDLASVVAPVTASFAAQAASAGVVVEAPPFAPLAVLADRDRLDQILNALLDNAIRHTPPGGTVSVVAVPHEGRMARLSVVDTGPGVDPADAPHVFERFYRADRSRDRAGGSTGLGLAIVRALAVAQGGAAGLTQTPGGGATFWVDIPIVLPGRELP